MKGFLVLCLSISLVSSFPRAQEEDESQANVSLEEDSEGDMMAADRVMAIGNYYVSCTVIGHQFR